MSFDDKAAGQGDYRLGGGSEQLDAVAKAFLEPHRQFLSMSHGLSSASITPTCLAVQSPPKTTATSRTTATGYVTPRQLARHWGIHIDKVLAFIRSGTLAAFNVASPQSSRPRYRISDEAVQAFELERAAYPSAVKNEPPHSRRRRRRPSTTGRRYF